MGADGRQSKESLGAITSSVGEALGISQKWIVDALSINTLELFGGAGAAIAIALNWNERDTETFARIAVSSAMAGIWAANPLLGLVALIVLAKAFQDAKSNDEYAEAAAGFVKGGAITGAVLITGSLIGGPAWVGLLAGIVLGALLYFKLKNFDGDSVREIIAWAKDRVRGFSQTRRLRDIPLEKVSDWAQRGLGWRGKFSPPI